MNKKETIYIIDGSSVIYRAFHAVPSSFTNAMGMPTNAVYGFTQTLRKIIKDFSPRYICVAFDVKGPSFRHGLFAQYKAERPPMPDALSVQIPYIKKIVKAFKVRSIEMPSYEADDVIATLAKRFEKSGLRIALITGDKDMYQLVNGDIVILDYLTEKEYGPAEVAEKFGVRPDLIRDLIGLAGDTSDNIPGVPGIGFKTAAKLLNKYGSMEAIFEDVENISGDKLRENLKTFKDQAFLSRVLATLHPDVPFECSLEDLEYNGPDNIELEPLLKELDFRKILAELLHEAPRLQPQPHDEAEYETVSDKGRIREVVAGARRLSITLRMTEEGFSGSLIGAGLSINPGSGYYIPVQHDGGMSEKDVAEALKVALEDAAVVKDTDDSKALYLYGLRNGVEVKGVGIDTSIASYLLNPSKSAHSIESLSYEYLGKVREEEGRGGKNRNVPKYTAENACNITVLADKLEAELEAESLKELYLTLELPLSRVLAGMETCGIKVDGKRLKELSVEMEGELGRMEASIYAAAGTEFNINSPKQLSEVLFDRLKLKPLKKTKTGYSTDEEVLTQLAAHHEVPQLIISFRQLAKLKSTYVDALSGLVNPATGRVHTSFNQTVTATGRLSSSKPNLQNIPVRGEAAGRIRETFVAEQGFTFISADYSQIELRIVAHMSEDPVLLDSFGKGEDIHTRTASEVFGVLPGLVTSEMRRRAKAINFGIIYGMGPFGLSTELGISMKEAVEYINSYFLHYNKVKEFIDSTVLDAARLGFTRTLFGRRRFIPELKSPVEAVVRLGQRLAINTPIQGSAADMIKAAMIKIDDALRQRGLRTRMLLQIHDELILEAALDERDEAARLLKEEMEGVIKLKVPVEVNLKFGANWRSVE